MNHDLVRNNPQLKKPVLAVLGLLGETGESCQRAAVEQAAQELWDPAFRQGVAATIDMLVRDGAIDQSILVQGEPYAGTLDDLQVDEAVPDDADVSVRIALTERGAALRDAYTPAATLQALLDERPQYAEVFEALLWACSNDEGCSRAAIESQINAMPQVQSAQPRVYPQYFIDALESAGGIAWDGAWRTTPEGRALLG